MTKEEYMRRKKIEQRKQRRRRRRIKKMIRLGVLAGMLLIFILLIVGAVSLVRFLFFREDTKENQESQPVVSEEVIQKESSTILTAGDIMMHDPMLVSNQYLHEDGTYDYHSVFKYIAGEYEAADLAVVNFETTIADGDYTAYPRFKSPEAIATALSDNYVDLCLLANNHIYDNQTTGLMQTIQAMEENHLLYTGVRKDTSEKNYYVTEIDGIKIGIFNYVFDSGSVDGQEISINSIPVSDEDAQRINTFNYGGLEHYLYSEIEEGLQELETQGVEYTIAYLHWGTEYETTENERQQNIAKELCELGIDALIGGHPHVVQPVDLLTNEAGTHQMVCVYSLGNHLSDQRKERIDFAPEGHTEDGLMVELILEKSDDGQVSLTGMEFIPTWVYKSGSSDNPNYYILPLNDMETLLKETADLGIETEAKQSLARTNASIGEGAAKIEAALPIAAK